VVELYVPFELRFTHPCCPSRSTCDWRRNAVRRLCPSVRLTIRWSSSLFHGHSRPTHRCRSRQGNEPLSVKGPRATPLLKGADDPRPRLSGEKTGPGRPLPLGNAHCPRVHRDGAERVTKNQWVPILCLVIWCRPVRGTATSGIMHFGPMRRVNRISAKGWEISPGI
jgi:hypothetical protein